MSVCLAKGQRVSLEKVAPGLQAVIAGLGWDTNVTDSGSDFDLDASVFMLGKNEKLVSDKHFIFYNNTISPDPNKSLEHKGDNLTGEGDGDDEIIKINLTKIPDDVAKIVFVVTIHEAEQRQQSFGQVSNAFVRLVNVVDSQV